MCFNLKIQTRQNKKENAQIMETKANKSIVPRQTNAPKMLLI